MGLVNFSEFIHYMPSVLHVFYAFTLGVVKPYRHESVCAGSCIAAGLHHRSLVRVDKDRPLVPLQVSEHYKHKGRAYTVQNGEHSCSSSTAGKEVRVL